MVIACVTTRRAYSRRTVDGPATYSYKCPAGDVSHMRIERFATRGGREGAQGGRARCMSLLVGAPRATRSSPLLVWLDRLGSGRCSWFSGSSRAGDRWPLLHPGVRNGLLQVHRLNNFRPPCRNAGAGGYVPPGETPVSRVSPKPKKNLRRR